MTDQAVPNPKCRECEGTGRIGYFYDQDCCRIVACWKCFPEDKAAARERDSWNRHSRDFEASQW
jgi:hypothetical protein